MEGFNIRLKLNSKNILGETQDDFSVSATTKESITKDDEGVKQVAVVGHEYTFSVSGLYSVNGSGETTKLDHDDIMEMVLKKGDDAVIPFDYGRTGHHYTGNCIITGYSESPGSEASEDVTFKLDCQVVGDLTLAS